ncbi:MAG: ribosome maturation factor RimP [Smithellaceae bacterium]|nr:ribosome maturation factor RimP [Smithellaceae bacterium]
MNHTKIYDDGIRGLVEPVVESLGMELVDLECLWMNTRWLVRLYIDRTEGVTVDDCALISNQVGDILEVHNVPAEPFTLEVSSPGLDRPLSRDKDFVRYRGSRIKVKLDRSVEGSKNITGVLLDYLEEAQEDKTILLSVSDRSLKIPRSWVKKANLVYEF